MSELRPFHIAFPVDDLAAARHSTDRCSAAPRVAAPSSGSTSTSSATRSSPIYSRPHRATLQSGRRP